jgi:integrase
MKRHKTSYPGVFYREAERIGGKGLERVYYIVFKKDGKVIEEKVGRQFKDAMTPSRADRIRAERIEGKRLSRKEIRQKATETKWTISQLWQEYSAKKPISKSLTTDRSRFQKFIEPALGNKQPAELSPMDLDRLRIRTAKNHKPQTVKHVIALLVRIINHGTRLGLCPGLNFKPPTIKVHNLKTEDLTPEQLTALLEAMAQEPDLQAANFMKLAFFTGMRRGELFKLRWEDIDFDRGFIQIRGPKGGRDQSIPLNQAARELLQTHPRDDDSPFVFPGRGGRQRSRPPKRIDEIKKRAGLPKDFRPLHGLRHTYASMLASSGQVDLYTLQKLLTHKSAAMTQRYSHLRDEAMRRAADVAGNLIGQALNGVIPQVVNLDDKKE